jgi:ribosome-associated protein
VTSNSLRQEIRWAVEAAQDKQAVDITALKLTGAGAFVEYFLLCSGSSSPQIQAICDAIDERLHRHGVRLLHREGKGESEWMLMDYGDFIVHIFSERAREYYALERLWRSAERIDFPAPSRPGETSQPGSSDGTSGRTSTRTSTRTSSGTSTP